MGSGILLFGVISDSLLVFLARSMLLVTRSLGYPRCFKYFCNAVQACSKFSSVELILRSRRAWEYGIEFLLCIG